MRKIIPLFLLAACAMGSKMVTMDAYCEVELCTPTDQLVELLGPPYAIHNRGEGCCEYEYIERVKIGARDAESRHYFIMIKDGQVVSKRVKSTIPLPQWFDSYEMQTTQKDEMRN